MIDYNKLQMELNEYAIFILGEIQREYEMYFSDKNKNQLTKLIQEENVVIISEELDENKICIPPMLKPTDYNKIKNYCCYYLIKELLKKFINISISQKSSSSESLEEDMSCSFCLNNGFIDYLLHDFMEKLGLKMAIIEPKQDLDFILFLQNNYSNFSALKRYMFSGDYFLFAEKFFEQTGDDLIDVYQNYLQFKSDELNEEGVKL